MSFFREHNHRLTGPVFTLLVLMFLFNVGIPSLTLSKTSHIAIVDDGGSGGTDGKPDEWSSPGFVYLPDFGAAHPLPIVSFIWLLGQPLVHTFASWF